MGVPTRVFITNYLELQGFRAWGLGFRVEGFRVSAS